MLARLLPIIALIVLCVLGWFLYSQGTIQKIIRPTVAVVKTQRSLIEGQSIRPGFITVQEISINRVTPGMVTFPVGSTKEDVSAALENQTISRNVPRDQFLVSTMLGERARIIVLQAIDDIEAGDNLTLNNVQTTERGTAPPGGAIVFDREEEGVLYLNQAYDLTAARNIQSGSVLTIDDTSGSSERVFVIRAARDFARSERLSIEGLEAAEISSREIPAGAITFQTRGAAEVFVTASGRYTLSEPLDIGQTLTADVMSNEGRESQERGPDALPETLSELTAYIQAYPERAMFLDPTNLIGRRVDPGDRVDIWAEVDRTEGAFGEIRMTRLAKGVLVREAVDNTRTSSTDKSESDQADEAGGAEEAESADNGTDGSGGRRSTGDSRFLWIVTDPDIKRRYDAARANSEAGVSFVIRQDARMVDVLGNGGACIQGTCQVNRKASDDLSKIVAQIRIEDDPMGQAQEVQQDPLIVMDGVSPALEQSLRANGYDTFEKIAEWQDSEMPAITIKLDISNNLAVYIRQQARIQVKSAQDAARSLGFEEAPTE